MTTVDRTSEPDAVFAEHLARMEAAPFAEEGAVERVARAIYNDGAWCGDCSYDGWDSCSECRRVVRSYARVALAAMCPAPGHDPRAAIRRVEALAEEYAERAQACADGFWKRHLWIVSQRLRAALRPADVAGDGGER